MQKEKDMFLFFSKFFLKKQITLFAPIPLSQCNIKKPYLLERVGISDGTAIMIAVPYFTKFCLQENRNISCYAVSRDYHIYFEKLYDELLPLLREKFSQYRFAGFADHSPIAEVEAAARAGLGVIGKNHLLITEKYSSFVFLGTLVTDAKIPCKTHPVTFCEGCGNCLSECPAKEPFGCLSALTQKKGVLSDLEQKAMITNASAWGCDRCQLVCPHTQKALETRTIFSPIPYFGEYSIPHLTSKELDAMSDEEFCARAYAWRGKDTIHRNLILLEQSSRSSKGE